MRATDGISRTFLWRDRELRWPVDRLLAASTIFVLSIGLFLLIRRATGALTAPLPGLQLVATAAAMFAWAIVVRELSSMRRIYESLSLAALLMFAIACSYPGARIVDWLVWLTAIAGLVLSARVRGAVRTAEAPRDIGGTGDRGELNNEQVLQRLTRCRGAEGQDIVRGELTAEFAPGERQRTLYVAFCPPFERLPHVEANIADDSDATVKIAQTLHNGTQLDVRLSHPAPKAARVTIELFATEAEAN